jgi:hypothetical protein
VVQIQHVGVLLAEAITQKHQHTAWGFEAAAQW